MAERHDGGPAFGHGAVNGHCCGMTIRDWFAGQAMLGEIVTSFSDATPEAAEALVKACAEHGHTPEQRVAINAYRIADAMIKAREAK